MQVSAAPIFVVANGLQADPHWFKVIRLGIGAHPPSQNPYLPALVPWPTRLRVSNPDNAIDRQIAAIALLHDLTVVTRNIDDFVGCGERLNNPLAGS